MIDFFFCIKYYGGEDMNNSISVNNLIELKNINIIDIRDRSEYVKGHIPTASNIDEYDLLFNTQKYLKKGVKYYIYCDYGHRSMQLARKLNMMGYDTVNIEGGYHNYLLSR